MLEEFANRKALDLWFYFFNLQKLGVKSIKKTRNTSAVPCYNSS